MILRLACFIGGSSFILFTDHITIGVLFLLAYIFLIYKFYREIGL